MWEHHQFGNGTVESKRLWPTTAADLGLLGLERLAA
jgi:hypothetical protein